MNKDNKQIKQSKRREKRRRFVKSRKLWIIFTFLTFFVMSASMLLTTLAILVAYDKGFIVLTRGISAFLPFSVTSVMVATVLSMFVSIVLLRPVKDVSDAATRIARGDFSKRVDENSLIEEIATAGKNFNLMISELEKLEGFRSDFGASVSHEFKTPLGKIKGYAELLKTGDLTEEEKNNCIEQIISGVDKLNTMSEKMLALARFENQQLVLNKTRFSLDEQIRQIFLNYENVWSQKNVTPNFELSDVEYFGDSYIVSHIWANLIENAVKFTPENGEININLYVKSKKVFVSIFNSGEGIKEKDINHIFEKFYQIDKSRKDRGCGLGLPLVKRLVELCGGDITVRSEMGKGTEFIVSLPFVEEEIE